MNSKFQGGLYPRGEERLALDCSLPHSPTALFSSSHTISRGKQPGPEGKPMKAKKAHHLWNEYRKDPILRFPLDYGLDTQMSNKVGFVAITCTS